MSAPPPPGTARGDALGQHVDEAMLQLIGSRGYAEVELDEICERAGIQRREFDRLYISKEECFLRIHGQITVDFCRRVDLAYESQGLWHDRLWAAGSAALRFLGEDPQRARFLLLELDGIGERACARRDQILQHLAEMIDGGRAESTVARSLSRGAAELVAGSLYGLVLAKLRAGWVERREQFLHELIYLALLPYRGAEAAEAELSVQAL